MNKLNKRRDSVYSDKDNWHNCTLNNIPDEIQYDLICKWCELRCESAWTVSTTWLNDQGKPFNAMPYDTRFPDESAFYFEHHYDYALFKLQWIDYL